MKIRVGKLRALIREALALQPGDKARAVANSTVDAADRFTDSLVAGSPDADAAAELKKLVDQAESLAQFLANHKDAKARPFANFVNAAKDLAADVGFWKRPAFFKREEYLQTIKDKLRRLQNAQVVMLPKS